MGDTVRTAGWLNFYSLKTKKIPAGRVASGDLLGCSRVGNRVGIFT